MKALVEACINDAEDVGLTLPYEEINRLLLAACNELNIRSTDKVLVVPGAGVGGRSVAARPPRPGLEGCLLRGDNILAEVIARSKVASRASALCETMDTNDRKKTM